jgi:predicted glutamine amidotransferase
MCRFLAKVSLKEAPLSEEVLDAENSLRKQAVNGCVPPGDPPGHVDGCGLAYVKDGQIKRERRGKENAWDDEFIKLVRATKCQLSMAHNRKATTKLGTNVSVERAHPFIQNLNGVPLAFCQNGSISAIIEQSNRENLVDTELFFRQILEGIEQADFDLVSDRVGYLAREYKKPAEKFTSLNAVLLSPTHLFAWRLFRTDDSHQRPAADWYDGYYTLWSKRSADQIVIASEPTDRGPGWELMKNGQFLGISLKDNQINIREKQLDF